MAGACMWAPLVDLAPGTTYSFIAGEETNGFSRELKFRTLPGGAPLRFVNGGDMGADGRARTIQRIAGSKDPDFAVLGGDLATPTACSAPEPLGRLAEELVGLHAAHRTALVDPDRHRQPRGQQVRLGRPVGPLALVPLALLRQGEKVISAARSGTTWCSSLLDTDHLNAVDGPQLEWLKAELEKYKHVPTNSRCTMRAVTRLSASSRARSPRAREVWGPLFDQYGVRVACEHHDHVARRSKPIKNGQVAESGTVYVGDGAMGRESRDVGRELRWYNAMEESTVHFWLVDVTPDRVDLQAIDRSDTVFDAVSLP